MDARWNRVVDNIDIYVSLLPHKAMPIGMSTDGKRLVNPVGNLNQFLIIITSYPTTRTIQEEHGVIRGFSNASMASVYFKLGLDRPGTESGVLHSNETPIRIDKLAAETAYGTSNWFGSNAAQTSSALRHVWDRFSVELLDDSKATVGAVLGKHAVRMMIRYFEIRGSAHELYFEDGSTSVDSMNSADIHGLVAIKEIVQNSERAQLHTMWFCSLDPEACSRYKVHVPQKKDFAMHYTVLLRERLTDRHGNLDCIR